MAATEVTPITINDRIYRKVTEGKATILAPYQKDSDRAKRASAQSGQPRNNDEGDQAVFYNPIQQYNRDLSVLAILIYGESAVELKNAKKQKNVARSQRKKKPRKEIQKGVSAPSELSEANGILVASKKRKADDAELDKQEVIDETKRSRHGEGQVEVDIEVQELNKGNAEASGSAPPQPLNANAGETAEPQPTRKTPFTILDALSASGLRAVRYAKEIPFATTIVANDMLPEAVEAIDLNIEHNGLQGKVFSNVGDARQYMYSKTGDEAKERKPGYVHKFDVVDLDPYGTAASFLDAAIQATADGGMLCVTCTDAGVWASNGYPEKAYALYNGTTLKGAHSHEAGLRLILHAVASTAAKYGIAIEPLLSLSIDFYARLFIRIHKSQQEVKLLAGTTMFVYNCDQGCGAWHTQLIARNQKCMAKNNDIYFKHGYSQAPSTDKYCQHCGSKTHLGGPMWAGPLHHPVFVQKLLDRLPEVDKTVYGTAERIKGMLTVALEEEELDWTPPSPAKTIGSTDSRANGETSTPADGFDDASVQISTSSTLNTSAIIPRMPPQLISPSPLFFLPTYLAKVLSIMTPAEDPFRGAFLGLGYTCTRSHCRPGSFKTNAPWRVIWEIAREWVRQKEAERIPRLLGEGEFEEKRSVKKGSPGYIILKKLRDRRGDTLAITKIKEGLVQKLGYGMGAMDIETEQDLQSVLKSVLYQLEHPKTNATAIETVDKEKPAFDTPKITGKALMDRGGDPSELEVVFDARLGKAFKERGERGERLVRYQINPRAHWGPMVRAGTG